MLNPLPFQVLVAYLVIIGYNMCMINLLKEAGEKLRDDLKSTFTRRIDGDEAGSYSTMALLGGIICSYLLLEKGDPAGAALLGSGILALCYEVENGVKIVIDNTKDAVNLMKDIVRR